jgi:DNA-binding transcriptional LysR family regulator
MGMSLYAAPDYVARHGPINGPQDYLNHRFIGPVDPDSRPTFYRWMRDNIPEQVIFHRVTDPEATSAAVRGGLGVGFVPKREAESAGLVLMMPELSGWDSSLWIVTHVDLHRTLKVQSFVSVLKKMAAGWSCE